MPVSGAGVQIGKPVDIAAHGFTTMATVSFLAIRNHRGTSLVRCAIRGHRLCHESLLCMLVMDYDECIDRDASNICRHRNIGVCPMVGNGPR